MPSSRSKTAEAMSTVLSDENEVTDQGRSAPLTAQLATLDVANNYSSPVTRDFVGRLGLDPSTLRPSKSRWQVSVSMHLSWSRRIESSPTSARVSSDFLLRLHNWLHELEFGAVGVIRSEDSSGRIIETLVDIRQQ
jgi:hypothetical protein